MSYVPTGTLLIEDSRGSNTPKIWHHQNIASLLGESVLYETGISEPSTEGWEVQGLEVRRSGEPSPGSAMKKLCFTSLSFGFLN